MGFGWQLSTSHLLRASHLKRWKTHFHKGQKSTLEDYPTVQAILSSMTDILWSSLFPNSVPPTPSSSSGSSNPYPEGCLPTPTPISITNHILFIHTELQNSKPSVRVPAGPPVLYHLALQAGAWRTLAEWVNALSHLESQDVAIKYLQGRHTLA